MDKVTIEVAIERDLLEEAATLDIDVPQAVEAAVRKQISDERARRWREENAEAIRASNEELARNGLWCDKYRMF